MIYKKNLQTKTCALHSIHNPTKITALDQQVHIITIVLGKQTTKWCPATYKHCKTIVQHDPFVPAFITSMCLVNSIILRLKTSDCKNYDAGVSKRYVLSAIWQQGCSSILGYKVLCTTKQWFRKTKISRLQISFQYNGLGSQKLLQYDLGSQKPCIIMLSITV